MVAAEDEILGNRKNGSPSQARVPYQQGSKGRKTTRARNGSTLHARQWPGATPTGGGAGARRRSYWVDRSVPGGGGWWWYGGDDDKRGGLTEGDGHQAGLVEWTSDLRPKMKAQAQKANSC